MKFRKGDKVKVTNRFLLQLPQLTYKVKGGGVIDRIFKTEAHVKFYSGCTYNIYLTSLRLAKNQQLLFDFMP